MTQMSPELEALARADDVAISDKNSRKKQYVGMGLFSLAGIAMATVMFASGSPVKKDFIEGDEEFQTTGFRAPSFLRDEKKEPQKPAQEILKLPEPAAPPPPVIAAVSEFNVPPPPLVQAAPVEAAPAASAPEALVPADEFPARFKSSQVVLDATKGASPGSDGGKQISCGAFQDRRPVRQGRQDRPHRCHDPGRHLNSGHSRNGDQF
jgi:type IV secretion system protein VirB10